jgi:predicted XRE-type DNA-binding protein
MRNGRRKTAKRDYIESSGNAFADLELPDADGMLAKTELATKIADIPRQRRLTQTHAAAILGVDQPKVQPLFEAGSRDSLSKGCYVFCCFSESAYRS